MSFCLEKSKVIFRNDYGGKMHFALLCDTKYHVRVVTSFDFTNKMPYYDLNMEYCDGECNHKESPSYLGSKWTNDILSLLRSRVVTVQMAVVLLEILEDDFKLFKQGDTLSMETWAKCEKIEFNTTKEFQVGSDTFAVTNIGHEYELTDV